MADWGKVVRIVAAKLIGWHADLPVGDHISDAEVFSEIHSSKDLVNLTEEIGHKLSSAISSEFGKVIDEGFLYKCVEIILKTHGVNLYSAIIEYRMSENIITSEILRASNNSMSGVDNEDLMLIRWVIEGVYAELLARSDLIYDVMQARLSMLRAEPQLTAHSFEQSLRALISLWEPQPQPHTTLPSELDAVGEPARAGLQVGVAADGRLTLVDRPIAGGARDDALGRELHGDVVEALNRLIVTAGRSNVVAEWREVAEDAKARLGTGPPEVRISVLLRIERLRSLKDADERRRIEPDPLVEPAEPGVAAALRDAVAAANFYIETDPYLAEQQRRLTDPEDGLSITTKEALAAEAGLQTLDIAEPALLAELREGRVTAEAGGRAGGRALAWLAGSWRNVVREVMRQVLTWVRMQEKAMRASVSEAAMQTKLGAAITIEESQAVLAAMGLLGGRAALGVAKAGSESAGRIWRHGEPVVGKAIAGGFVVWLADQIGLLTRLGWTPEIAAKIQLLLKGISS